MQDIICGDELMSDSFEPALKDDVVYEVDCAMITLGAVNVGAFLPAPSPRQALRACFPPTHQTRLTMIADTGANASAEEAAETLEDGESKVNNVINTFRLQNTSFDKKSYMGHLKTYLKKVKVAMKEKKNASDEDIKKFETSAQAYVKKIIANIGDYEFYVGESMDPDAMYVSTNRHDLLDHLLTCCVQGRSPELPRRWRHALRDLVEGWTRGDEGMRAQLCLGQRDVPFEIWVSSQSSWHLHEMRRTSTMLLLPVMVS